MTAWAARVVPTRALGAAIAAVIASAVVWSVLDHRGPQFLVVTWTAFGLSLVIAYSTRPELRTSASPVTILAVLVILYGAYVPAEDLAHRDTVIQGINYASFYPTASAVTALAGFGFVLGYLASPRPSMEEAEHVHAQSLAGFRIVGAIAWLLLVYRLGRYGFFSFNYDAASSAGVSGYLTYSPQYVGSWGLIMSHGGATRRQRTIGWISVIFAGFLTVNAFARYIFVILSLSTLLLTVWRRVGVRRSLPVLLVGLLAAGALVGYQGHRRSEARHNQAAANQTESTFRTDVEIVAPLAAVISWADQHPYINGASYVFVIPQVVPRQIWHGKPIDPTLRTVANFTDPHEGRSFPLWGEMYLNFGAVGVLLGMLLFGYGYGRLIGFWASARAPLVDATVALCLALIVQVFSRALFTQAVYNGFSFLIVPFVLVWFNRRLLRRQAAAAQAPLLAAPSSG